MKSITVSSSEREEMVDITGEVGHFIADQASTTPSSQSLGHPSSGRRGAVILFTQHTTCGLTINENADPDVKSDMLGWLRRLVPQFPTTPSPETGAAPSQTGGEPFFKHFEHNSDAHIKSSLVGSSVTVPFENGKLLLGRWQGIYLCEFDGPRERTVIVQIMNAE